jgi:hypothetical protein
MFWDWMLKYSSLLVTAAISFFSAWLLHKLTTKNPDLVYYASQPQWVVPPLPQSATAQPAAPIPPIGTFTLFLWNQGRAPAKNVHVGHFWLPPQNVYPDIPRDQVPTPSGGVAIRFPVIPPKTLISISYMFFNVFTVNQIVSYVGSEEAAAKHIPVMLQRVFPKWFNRALVVLVVAGIWVAINLVLSLIKLLWITYYAR